MHTYLAKVRFLNTLSLIQSGNVTVIDENNEETIFGSEKDSQLKSKLIINDSYFWIRIASSREMVGHLI
ncbi:hypothetical protein AYI70_g2206 [Smittium culicis]|uniref:Uncharacterized protein n=1 Tax=Smittium culicis TaxID=133412 RepID=A0A1R1Y9J4_9FUNG|nr:hypothetical protein AYI70_g2206 [Smittium culicis]